MPSERAWVLWWLPVTFAIEVAAWELDSRLGLGILDASWNEVGELIDVDRFVWAFGGAVVVLLVLFLAISRYRHPLPLSLVQLLGVGALAGYWVGASTLASGAVVALATFAAWLLEQRPSEANRACADADP